MLQIDNVLNWARQFFVRYLEVWKVGYLKIDNYNIAQYADSTNNVQQW